MDRRSTDAIALLDVEGREVTYTCPQGRPGTSKDVLKNATTICF